MSKKESPVTDTESKRRADMVARYEGNRLDPAHAMKCPYCSKPLKKVNEYIPTTCGRSECQEASYRANMERVKPKARKLKPKVGTPHPNREGWVWAKDGGWTCTPDKETLNANKKLQAEWKKVPGGLKKLVLPKEPFRLRVWWIPQVPMQAFRVDVKTIDEAKLLLATLARYDQFQLDNNIKPDYCNTGGLETFEDGEWSEWCDEETGNNISDIMKNEQS